MDFAAVYDCMGAAWAEDGRGDLPQALGWYQKSLDVVVASRGDKHPQAADTMFNIAEVNPELRRARTLMRRLVSNVAPSSCEDCIFECRNQHFFNSRRVDILQKLV